jgi:hypothetical protein
MTVFYVHAVAALSAVLLGSLAGWGGLALIIAKRTHGRVKLPFGFKRKSHVRFGVIFIALLLLTLVLGYVASSRSVGENDTLEAHGIVAIVVTIVYALGALVGLALVRLHGTKPALRTLHAVLNYGGCVLLAVQVVLGLVILSRFW